MNPLLQPLDEAGIVSPLDLHFARGLARLYPDEPPSVFLGAALASRAVRHGHVCADLRQLVEQPLLDEHAQPIPIQIPSIFQWAMELGASPLVSAGERPTPLVFDGEARLYLARYWRYQQTLAHALRARVMMRPPELDSSRLRKGLARLFTDHLPHRADPWQRLAAMVAATRGLTVISGGPGTGKTSTVVRILALLQEQALGRGAAPLRIQLFAPTGKAAARLGESILARRDDLPIADAVRATIPTQAATIHRGLGYRPLTPTQMTHHAGHPLPVDLALVDEASMVDLALMAKLVDAVPAHARLVLLGDKNQLASVEAGAILGDICRIDDSGGYSEEFRHELRSLAGPDALPDPLGPAGPPGIGDCIVELVTSYRFSSSGGIGGLARAIKTGNGPAATAALGAPIAAPNVASGSHAIALVPLRDDDDLPATLRPLLRRVFASWMDHRDPIHRLEALGAFRLLSPHRRGQFGVRALNRLVEDELAHAGLINPREPWYDGRPIIITENDHQLELYNGDIGVVQREGRAPPQVIVSRAGGGIRSFSPARMPPHQTVFAMTVHKSQGSEFERVALVLPAALSPVLTRELIYTAVTRARTQLVIYGQPSILEQAIERRIDRASGLHQVLWEQSPT